MTKIDRTSQEYRRLLEQEALIADAQELISELMEKHAVTQKELAKRIGKSKGFVSQVMSGTRNMTLRTFADFAFALGARVSLEPQRLNEPRRYRGQASKDGSLTYGKVSANAALYETMMQSAFRRPSGVGRDAAKMLQPMTTHRMVSRQHACEELDVRDTPRRRSREYSRLVT